MQVVFRGDCLTSSGYSNTNASYVTGLMELGVNVKLVEQLDDREHFLSMMDKTKADMLRTAMDRPMQDKYIYFNRTVWDCFHHYDRAVKTFASTVWETDPFPNHWIDSMNKIQGVDSIVVPSHFNKRILEDKINKPVKVLREGIYLDKFKDVLVDKPITSTFNFLSIFQWLPRKGYDVLLEAFFREFNESDNVSLVIKTSSLNYDVVPSSSILGYITALKRKFKKNLNVYIMTTQTSYDKILELYNSCHSFVLPTRAEGYCRPCLEAMASHLPVIVTGWGGQTDFVNNDNGYLIDYQLTPVTPQWYCGDFQPYQVWAEPNIEHLGFLMRKVYENYDEAKEKARRANNLAQTYDYRLIAKDFKNILFN